MTIAALHQLIRTIATSNVMAAGPPTDAVLPAGGNATAMTDIHDIKPILALGGNPTWWYWLLAGLVLAGLAAVVWWWWRRRRKKEPASPAEALASPEREAYQALDALAAENGLTPRQFYFRLSAVVRRYTERRFDFPAAEMTTEELLPRLEGLALHRDLVSELKMFCRSADPVKFADAPAHRERMVHDLALARDYVRQTTAETAEQTGGTLSNAGQLALGAEK